jgi:hypothetical protein
MYNLGYILPQNLHPNGACFFFRCPWKAASELRRRRQQQHHRLDGGMLMPFAIIMLVLLDADDDDHHRGLAGAGELSAHRVRVPAMQPSAAAHSTGSSTFDGRTIGPFNDGAVGPTSKRSPLGNRKPLTSPKIAGITISVSSVDEIIPPIIGTAVRCMISVPVLHMIGIRPAVMATTVIIFGRTRSGC